MVLTENRHGCLCKKLPATNLLAGKILYFFDYLLEGERFKFSSHNSFLKVSFLA